MTRKHLECRRWQGTVSFSRGCVIHEHAQRQGSESGGGARGPSGLGQTLVAGHLWLLPAGRGVTPCAEAA